MWHRKPSNSLRPLSQKGHQRLADSIENKTKDSRHYWLPEHHRILHEKHVRRKAYTFPIANQVVSVCATISPTAQTTNS